MRQRALIGLVVALAASALLGLAGGLVWSEIAPRVALQEISAGTAEVVNAETRAFIGADGWFCVIAAAGGLLTGVIGYRAGIARRDGLTRIAVTIGLIAGAVAGSYVMLWLGQQIGLGTYQNHLAHAAKGTTFNASLILGAKSSLVFWPLLTSIVIVVAEVGRSRDQEPEPAGLAPDGQGAP
ncbi:MAG TPA: hypothetical protein VMG38_01915 [Trebonia sp.]|nr:hypothetical protein [Trebonia sp.]